MSAVTFDTHQAVRRLEAAGIETCHAEAIVSEMRDAGAGDRDQLATKADLEPLATKANLEPLATKAELEPLATKAELKPLATKAELEPLATKAELAGLEARMYRALWIQGGAIVAILTGLKLLT